MERPDKISIKEAAEIANTGTVKQRCAAQRKRLRAKYQRNKTYAAMLARVKEKQK